MLKHFTKTNMLFFIGIIISAWVLIKIISLYQAIKPTPITYWRVSDENSQQVLNHQRWQEILSTYLQERPDGSGRRFNYQGVTQADKAKLEQYLMQLQRIKPRQLNQNEQLAYWINLYNALTVNLVIKHFPIESIKEIGDGITGPWNMSIATVEGMSLTLNNIEHGILRGIWKDNRIHYVINCASIGCPDLPSTPIVSENINQQLNQGAIRFINQEKALHFIEGTLILSSIYNWFSDDFGANNQILLQHLMQYAKPVLKTKLRQYEGEIDFTYNWKLNSF